MALPNLENQNIQDTYQRVVQTDGTKVYDGTGSLLPIEFNENNVIISGTLTAQTYVVSESITSVSSGSTIFGNSKDDTHQMTGSLNVSSSITTPIVSSTYLIGTLTTPSQPSITSLSKLTVTNTISASNIETDIGIGHRGDNDTKIGFTEDLMAFQAGGETFMTYTQLDSAADQFVLDSFSTTHITASGDISSSGTIFTDLIKDGTNNTSIDLSSTTITATGILDLPASNDATDASGDTGTLRLEGGASIAKKLFVGTYVSSSEIRGAKNGGKF